MPRKIRHRQADQKSTDGIGDECDPQLNDKTNGGTAVREVKCISLSLFTGLLLFGSVVQPSVAQTLGTKVDIGKSVLCENVQLDHLVKEGAGGGGTVFSAYRRQPNSKMPEMDSTAPQVIMLFTN